jgi:membrane protease YdiL (CAAX protease family)
MARFRGKIAGVLVAAAVTFAAAEVGAATTAEEVGGVLGADALEARALADSLDSEPEVRQAALAALGTLGSRAAIDRLWLAARADGDASVRAAAVEAMAARRDPGFLLLLRAVAEGDPDPTVRAVAERNVAYLKAWRRSPGVAALFSVLCPGCGYFYLGKPLVAATYLGSSAALLGGALLLRDGRDVDVFAEGAQGPNMTPTTAPLALPLASAAANLGLYSAFAAYRDARLARNDEGYHYPVSRESLGDLVLAPVHPRVLARPWFWAGVPAIFGALWVYSKLADEAPTEMARTLGEGQGVWFLGRKYSTPAGVALGELYYASLFLPVGIGEEALFRGVLQPAFTEALGLWPGWLVTSLLFGAAHIPNFFNLGWKEGLWALPFITATGSYMGAVAIKTGFQLETSVAIHFWYDFLLGTFSFLGDPDHQPFSVKLTLPL